MIRIMANKLTTIITIMAIISICGFLTASFLIPQNSYIIGTGNKNSAIPVSAAKLLTASLFQLTGAAAEPSFSIQNILILGVPGQSNTAPFLTDTIMILRTVKEKNTTKIATISIPRDTLIEYNGKPQKINSLYAFGRSSSHEQGIDNIKTEIEKITGLEISKYILIDIDILEETVNQMNGINVWVPQDIYDPLFPAPDGSYRTFGINKGWRYLDGATATKYARTRHDNDGDFGRMKRQIQILHALKNKISAMNPVLNLPKFLKILKNLNDHIKTDLKSAEIVWLWSLLKNINTDNVRHMIIDANQDKNLLINAEIMIGNQKISALMPIEGMKNYDKINLYVKNWLTE